MGEFGEMIFWGLVLAPLAGIVVVPFVIKEKNRH
jgi:hypothetical protein